MEQQLAEYRARKAQERNAEKKSAGASVLQSFRGHNGTPTLMDKNEGSSISSSTVITGSQALRTTEPGPIQKVLERYEISFTKIFFLKIALWIILFGLFIELEFGSVYVIGSFFYLIYATLSTERREPGKLSAYSVFNPNFEKLDGQFTAKQFEKELRYGAGSVGPDK